MDAVARGADRAALAGGTGNSDFGFLPEALVRQCRSLIQGYHELHGYTCLPDVLWKARLGPFIEDHDELRQLLRKASTTRSAKKSNEGFSRIATTILALEILSCGFAGWSTLHPQAASRANGMLRRNARIGHMPLMEFYLYPPKYISPAVLATLAPRAADNRPHPPEQDFAADASGLDCGALAVGVPASPRPMT
jgi:hypothetical protein